MSDNVYYVKFFLLGVVYLLLFVLVAPKSFAAYFPVLIALIMLIHSSTAAAGDKTSWTAQDTTLQLVYTAVNAADWAQTRYIARNPRTFFEQGNLFIGHHPDMGRVDSWFAMTTLAHAAVSWLLPRPYRSFWQSFWIGYEANAVGYNYRVGVAMRF